jgi:hypothetical protein
LHFLYRGPWRTMSRRLRANFWLTLPATICSAVSASWGHRPGGRARVALFRRKAKSSKVAEDGRSCSSGPETQENGKQQEDTATASRLA